MKRKKVLVIVCAPSLEKKATKNVQPPFIVITTEKNAVVAEQIIKARASKVFYYRTPIVATNDICHKVANNLQEETPNMELILNPHQKQKIPLCSLLINSNAA